MQGVLNVQTGTVHRLDGAPSEVTECGALDGQPAPVLEIVDVGDETGDGGTRRCDSCFDSDWTES